MTMAPQGTYSTWTSNVPADSVDVWAEGRTNTLGDRVQHEEKIYEYLSNQQLETVPGTNNIVWYFVEATNKAAILDPYMDTKTVHDNDIVMTFGISDLDVIALFGLHCQSVKIEVRDNTSNETVFTYEEQMVDYMVSDWYEWTFPKQEYKSECFSELPMIADATVTVTIKKSEAATQCAHLTMGRTEDLHCTQWGASVGLRSNTRRERNASGHVFLKKGISWKRMSVPVKLDTISVDALLNKFNKVDGVPTLFIGDERKDGLRSMMIFGFYRDFDVAIDVSKSSYNIEIEGVG